MADGSVIISASMDISEFRAQAAVLQSEVVALGTKVEAAIGTLVGQAGVAQMLGAVRTQIEGMFATLPAILSRQVQTAVRQVQDAVHGGGWQETGGAAGAALAGGFRGAVSSLPQEAGTTATGVRAAFGADWHRVGREMMAGLAAGIREGAGAVLQASSAVSAVVMRDTKAYYRIASPSAKMRDEVGVMLSRGVADGILAGQGEVEDAMRSLGRITVPQAAWTEKGGGSYRQSITFQQAVASPYQTARAIRRQSEELLTQH